MGFKFHLLILVFLAVAFQTYADVCSEQDNCDDCAAIDGCGWCAPTQQCLSGTIAGPTNSTCVGRAWEYGKCTPCGDFKDCRSCLVYDQDCFWCGSANNGEGECKPKGFAGCLTTVRTCPCTVYGSCSTCIDDPNCQWCGESQLCTNLTAICPNGQTGYNFNTSCPCSLNQECSTCFETSGCKWCNPAEGAGPYCESNKIACAGASAQGCQSYCETSSTNCESCTSLPGCGWCPELGKCVDTATSLCEFVEECPECQFAETCDACGTSPFCIWCDDSGSCQPKGTACFVAHTCESFCEKFTDCDQCNKVQGCGWCDDSNKCADVNTANCFFAHSCTYTPIEPQKCGFNSGSFVGGMFLVLGIFVVAAIAYVFYKWKSAPKTRYSELK